MIQIRPRSSNVIATGLMMSGSAATTSTVKARRDRHRSGRLGRRARRVGRLVLTVGNRSFSLSPNNRSRKPIEPFTHGGGEGQHHDRSAAA